ncbi:acetyltransferase [Virgisporangium aliadipatigenens]|uniref:Acetyltransferase n=1 Tax=Virgisporangium aliadipatigenens TaxID=741659 RepID=A0A8J3YQ34_9ACTN|nr:GNAT family N-acetyltransferase [Virgisporangium aliadipatigenens]GIJ48397.1 acetyltransferase [Virgisporangium aliadipatigenens]
MNLHDLEPHLAANRHYWASWDRSGVGPDSALPIYRTGITQPLFNGVLRLRDRPLPEAIGEAKRRLDGARWAWWVAADSDPGTAEGLLAHGAEHLTYMSIMGIDVTNAAPSAPSAPPDDLKIQRVEGRAQTEEFVALVSTQMGFTGDQRPIVERELELDGPDFVRLAGVVDGRIVGACLLSLRTDVGGLYNIATAREHRRRGIATTLVLEALRITRESGRRLATLQAGSEGEPVYRRVGFETVGRYQLFRLP